MKDLVRILIDFIAFFFLAINSLRGDFMKERENMVEYQIKRRGVTNKVVLKALLEVERHNFVIDKYQKDSYADSPLPIGYKQTISQPYIVGLMTELINPMTSDKVLEIGTGSGYQTAIIGKLVKNVYSIEIIKELAERSRNILNKLGYKNISIKHGDGYKGWQEYAPFDKIIVTAAPETIPENLIKQLKVGGLMVIPVGKGIQELLLIRKEKNKIISKRIINVRFVPMVNS